MIKSELRPVHPGEILREDYLARYFGTSERFWMNLQMEYELRTAQIAKAAQVEQEVDPHAA